MNEKIKRIIERLHEIQDTGKYTVFYGYFGHVKSFDIKIYKGKWRYHKRPLFEVQYKIEDEQFLSYTNFRTVVDIEDIMNNLKIF